MRKDTRKFGLKEVTGGPWEQGDDGGKSTLIGIDRSKVNLHSYRGGENNGGGGKTGRN